MYVKCSAESQKVGYTSYKGGQSRPVVHCLLLEK